MRIIHYIDDFLFSIFPNINRENKDLLVSVLQEFYSVGRHIPTITLSGEMIIIDLDTTIISAEESKYRQIISLCDQKKFQQAKPILENLIKNNPTKSEYHRILGQILFDENDFDGAIDSLIDSLRWDPTNKWALLLMGNIFWRYKRNFPVALQYYDQVLKIDPDDYLSINNIGATLLEQGNYEEAKKYFLKSLDINDKYANAHYGIGNIYRKENDLYASFESSFKAILYNPNHDRLMKESLSQAFSVAESIVAETDGKKLFSQYLHRLEFEGDRPIELVIDSQIPTNAKMEFAENYKRDKHILRFKPGQKATDHLILHELVHLDLVLQARKQNENQLFISTQEHRQKFTQKFDLSLKRLKKMGISDKKMDELVSMLFTGMNTQIFNVPVDLFIEEFIYNEFPKMRPFQFLSLYALLSEGIQAVTKKEVIDLMPPQIVTANKIYQLVTAMQYKALYGIDLIREFKANSGEINTAQSFYDEFVQYKDDRKPAEEYELVQHWAEDLKLDTFFDFVDENKFRNKLTDPEMVFESLESDPLGFEDDLPEKEKDMKKFREGTQKLGFNHAVAMYMVSAIKFYKELPLEKVKELSLEIALQGTQGYSPDKSNYKLNSFPNKEFTGYEILAYYYVCWKIAHPEMVSQLGLPYDKEYSMAIQMISGEK